MSLLANVLGFSAFGFATRCFQLGIQKKHMFEAPQTHLVAMAAFGAIGWGVYEMEGRQQIMIDQRRTMLLETRRKENEEYERKKAEGVDGH
ncbi:hypothetical protein FFLO_02815 [Filobasidium floriforme]|uniref:Uncharacterized protein n=1 Tax=Filobasidium floriforme TaxID=5210 RepID=A0A8K0JNE3_9TREE|nr:uncharacterized protein HD553DRAFT_344753 [Filobasidium floriforme]KAG7558252.1 hypothetical protein FFLO_02815 [Filobasidium floriforme]KAH8080475.1 hypothetical protein HD553DRAFT_344753 [Filobasidium floriforme]